MEEEEEEEGQVEVREGGFLKYFFEGGSRRRQPQIGNRQTPGRFGLFGIS